MANPTGHARSRAALVIRCLAACLDLLCLALVARAVELIAAIVLPHLGITRPAPIITMAQICAVLLISTSEFLGDASPGKLLCGLRIRSIDGQPAPMHRRVVRWALKTIPLWLAFVAAYLEQQTISRGVRSDPLAFRFYTAATFATMGLFIAFAPAGARSRQALYDMIARMGVFPAKPEHLDDHRGFEPVIPIGD